MAVDLTPRFRRLNSQTRSFRENVQHVFTGPFGATQLWHNIIQALQTQVEVRRCRRHLRVHNDCFTGSDAVDAVLSYLMQNVVFCTSEVSRLKAARLCQALMEAKVFEPVGTKLFRRDKEVTFEDSGCSLYRFLEHKVLQSSSVKNCSSDTEDKSSEKLGAKRKKSSRLNDQRTITNPLAVGPSDKKVERLLKTINLQPSLSTALSTAPTSSAFLSKAVVDEVWKQQTLLQLLQIVELPMLDCILTSPARFPSQACRGSVANQDLVISNRCLEREVPDTLHLPHLDRWLSAAADCLELLPDQLIVVAGEQLSQQTSNVSLKKDNTEQETNQKRLLFDIIAKYYSGQEKAPLLSGRFVDIHAAILNLLDEGKVQDANTASQLCLRLLETSVREELRRLLAFMATAAHLDSCRLQKQSDNRTLVCRTFQKAIVQNHGLNRSQSETLVLFLMDNHTELFKTPASLIEAVRRTLRTMQQGKDPDSIATFTFCQQVTPQEYEDQQEAATLEGLKQLLHDISLSKSMPVKEKRRLLKEFEKHHPVRTITNPLAVGPSDKKVERLLKTINLQPSLSTALSTAPTSSAFLSKAVVDEVWKQQTLLQLLQIVELPMLDCILTSPARFPSQACRGSVANQDLVISNRCLEREVPDTLHLPHLDRWLSAAADCLELLPDQLIVVAGEQLSQQTSNVSLKKDNTEQETNQKRLLFDIIAKYYSGQEKAPLLSGRFVDIHAAILNLLDEGKVQDANTASQLCLRLLETSVREELRRLLAFMATAAHLDSCRLQKQSDNRTLVCRTFQKAIVQNHGLNRSQSETLVLFLMDNHTELFKTPASLIEAVRRTLRTMQQGKDPDSIATFTFCQQVTPQEYEDQQEAATLEGLKQLLHDISLSKSMPVKEKRRLLKEFEKHHPVVFLQHFSSTF